MALLEEDLSVLVAFVSVESVTDCPDSAESMPAVTGDLSPRAAYEGSHCDKEYELFHDLFLLLLHTMRRGIRHGAFCVRKVIR